MFEQVKCEACGSIQLWRLEGNIKVREFLLDWNESKKGDIIDGGILIKFKIWGVICKANLGADLKIAVSIFSWSTIESDEWIAANLVYPMYDPKHVTRQMRWYQIRDAAWKHMVMW